MMRALAIAVVACVTIGMCWVANARPPANGGDPALAEWFHSLKSNNGIACCDESDGRMTESRQAVDGSWEALVDDRWEWYQGEPTWIKVPAEAILQRADNPTGKAVLFLHPINGRYLPYSVLCFIRPAEV